MSIVVHRAWCIAFWGVPNAECRGVGMVQISKMGKWVMQTECLLIIHSNKIKFVLLKWADQTL